MNESKPYLSTSWLNAVYNMKKVPCDAKLNNGSFFRLNCQLFSRTLNFHGWGGGGGFKILGLMSLCLCVSMYICTMYTLCVSDYA
jgi:hypothetical protein